MTRTRDGHWTDQASQDWRHLTAVADSFDMSEEGSGGGSSVRPLSNHRFAGGGKQDGRSGHSTESKDYTDGAASMDLAERRAAAIRSARAAKAAQAAEAGMEVETAAEWLGRVTVEGIRRHVLEGFRTDTAPEPSHRSPQSASPTDDLQDYAAEEAGAIGASEGHRRGGGRRLLDTFGDSLVFTNQLYNRRFGNEQRKVPAHMPHFINRRVMQKLQKEFEDQWHETSQHRFRSSTDLQYGFAYFYYLMNSDSEKDLDWR